MKKILFLLLVLFLMDGVVTAVGTAPTKSLNITKVGAGTVTITPKTGTPVNCAATANTCSASFPEGTTVTLTTTNPSNLIFSGWSLGTGSAASCNGNKGTCSFTLSLNSALQAMFVPFKTISVEKVGLGKDGGVITSEPAGINCGTGCTVSTASLPQFTVIKLLPQSAGSGEFIKFENATGSANNNNCGGPGCEFLIQQDSTVKAQFVRIAETINLKVTMVLSGGQGTVKVLPGANVVIAEPTPIVVTATRTIAMGIRNFQPNCPGLLDRCARFTLKPEPSAGSRFAGWSAGTGKLRDCDGVLSDCEMVLTRSESTTATFIPQ